MFLTATPSPNALAGRTEPRFPAAIAKGAKNGGIGHSFLVGWLTPACVVSILTAGTTRAGRPTRQRYMPLRRHAAPSCPGVVPRWRGGLLHWNALACASLAHVVVRTHTLGGHRINCSRSRSARFLSPLPVLPRFCAHRRLRCGRVAPFTSEGAPVREASLRPQNRFLRAFLARAVV